MTCVNGSQECVGCMQCEEAEFVPVCPVCGRSCDTVFVQDLEVIGCEECTSSYDAYDYLLDH